VRPEAQFEHFLGLAAKGFRIIAPWLPTELAEFEDYAAGIMLVLRQERIEKVHLYGLAFGAMIAQYTAYRFPRRVQSMVLAFGCAPEEEISHRIQKCVKRNDFHNSWLMRNLVGYKTSAKELEAAKPDIEPDETRLFLLVIRKFQTPKAEVASRTKSLIDYHGDVQFIPEDFAKYTRCGGRVLLIDSAASSDEERLAELRLLHPDAVLHTLEAGATPLSALLRGEEIGNAIASFIGAPSREHIAEQQRKLEEKVKRSGLPKK
jgi:pimeloyl-ACP methyl ester carboxylesterase